MTLLRQQNAASQVVQAIHLSTSVFNINQTELQQQWHVAFGAHNAITHSVRRWSRNKDEEVERAAKVLCAIFDPLTKWLLELAPNNSMLVLTTHCQW